jgi:hypothetical protein
MKTHIFLIWSFALSFSDLFSQEAGTKSATGFYVLADYQYFMPLMADIRKPQFYTRLYRNEAVKFSNLSTTRGHHLFWDVGYGGFFPLLGYNYKENAAANPMQITGWALFIESSAHMLLDFSTPSADVINTDFRIGGGLASRLPKKLKNITLRYKLFHESTHVGDEFILTAVADSAFRRYNVSYEAHEFFISFDRYSPAVTNRRRPVYWRAYAMSRFLTKEVVFDDFRDRTQTNALKTASRGELQLGGEIFVRGRLSVAAEGKKLKDFVKRTFAPSYWVAAADFYRRDKYAVSAPQKVWSYNLVLGPVYGNYFTGERTTKLLLNYYRGVNPHGQFRMFEISYLGISYGVDF